MHTCRCCSHGSKYATEFETTQATYYDDGYGMEGEGEDEYEEITQEDCWTVISSFFDQKGLVRQQLDSFDEFVQNTMQELVDENADLILDQADQHTGHEADVTRRYEIKFGQIYLSRPTVTEADGSVVPVFPQEARLRNLTYSAPLYIEMKKRVLVGREDPDSATGDMLWETEQDDSPEDVRKVWIGKVRSSALSAERRPFMPLLGSNHAPVHVLYSPRAGRSRAVRLERVPVRLRWILHHQWFREGPYCSGAYGYQPRLRVRQGPAFSNQFPRGDSQRGRERWEDHQSVPGQALSSQSRAVGMY